MARWAERRAAAWSWGGRRRPWSSGLDGGERGALDQEASSAVVGRMTSRARSRRVLADGVEHGDVTILDAAPLIADVLEHEERGGGGAAQGAEGVDLSGDQEARLGARGGPTPRRRASRTRPGGRRYRRSAPRGRRGRRDDLLVGEPRRGGGAAASVRQDEPLVQCFARGLARWPSLVERVGKIDTDDGDLTQQSGRHAAARRRGSGRGSGPPGRAARCGRPGCPARRASGGRLTRGRRPCVG